MKKIGKSCSNLVAFLLCSACCACNMETKPFINHSLKYTKLAPDCAGKSAAFNMHSNTAGERYEFQQCLDSDFDPSRMTIERKGDTLVVAFSRKGVSQSLYDLVLDIDAYPAYHYLTIGEASFRIASSEN